MDAAGLRPRLPARDPGDAHQDLDSGRVAALREHGALYDWDERGGEFLHFYTVMLGRRLFFEVVQRTGGYADYGAPSTPVRMAAQLRHAAMIAD
jgi:4-hydroxyphenylpyruvate dioxygenase